MREWITLAAVCSVIMATLAVAQEPSSTTLADQTVTQTVADQKVKGYEFETHYLHSVDQQRRYRVYLALPTSPAPESGRPSIYMLDGNAVMATLTADDLIPLSQLTNPPVLIAIGYDIATRNDVIARSYDYTPPVFEQGQRVEQPVVRGRIGGGADRFLSFINDAVIPLVQTRTALDASQRTLWGHSYGGLFTMYASAQAHSPFQHYIAADPSLWWYEQALIKTWDDSVSRLKGRTLSVHVGTRGRGEEPTASLLNDPSVNPLMQRLALLQKASWSISYRAYPQYGHGEMIKVSLLQMLSEFTGSQQ